MNVPFLPSSDREITALLMATLRAKLLDLNPHTLGEGGVFLPEVTHPATGKRADVIFIGLTNASGRTIAGYEIKASRSDWLREVNTRSKADTWADECQSWTVVSIPGVVKVEELPSGFGLLELKQTPKTTRLVSITPARVYEERVPSWYAYWAVLARVDSLRVHGIQQAQQDQKDKDAQEIKHAHHVAQDAMLRANKAENAQTTLNKINSALGMDLSSFTNSRANVISIDDFTSLMRNYITAGCDLKQAADNLVRSYDREHLTSIKKTLADLESALSRLRRIAS